MLPLRDANPTRRTPIVTLALVVACSVVFAYELGVLANGGDTGLERFIGRWGTVPVEVSAALSAGRYTSGPMLAIVTSLFLHGSWLHLVGNMLFLWIFGNNIEDRLGRLPFLVFYVAGGIVATLAQVAIDPRSTAPIIGASGAIAATLGAYFVLYPGARILSLVFLVFFYQLINVPAIIVLGYWFLLQLVDGVGSLGGANSQGGVAIFAHIGGFVAGMAVGAVMRIFSRGRRTGPTAAARVG